MVDDRRNLISGFTIFCFTKSQIKSYLNCSYRDQNVWKSVRKIMPYLHLNLKKM